MALILTKFFLVLSLLIKHGFDSMIWSQNELMHWIEKAEKPPLKIKETISGSELMATVFWDYELNLFIE